MPSCLDEKQLNKPKKYTRSRIASEQSNNIINNTEGKNMKKCVRLIPNSHFFLTLDQVLIVKEAQQQLQPPGTRSSVRTLPIICTSRKPSTNSIKSAENVKKERPRLSKVRNNCIIPFITEGFIPGKCLTRAAKRAYSRFNNSRKMKRSLSSSKSQIISPITKQKMLAQVMNTTNKDTHTLGYTLESHKEKIKVQRNKRHKSQCLIKVTKVNIY